MAFWRSSGLHLLEKGPDGTLVVTADFLRAYLQRPELAPIAESCQNEIALHKDLMTDPFSLDLEHRIESLADPDAQDNYRVYRAFQSHLNGHQSIEQAYLALFNEGSPIRIPPLFIDQLVHAMTHNLVSDTSDALKARAGELLFRSQRVMTGDQGVLSADEEVIEMHARSGGMGSLGKLVRSAETPLRNVDLDILNADNMEHYWSRSDRFDMVLDLTFARPGLDALSRVLESWVAMLAGLEVSIQPVRAIRDENWAWHIGLDVMSSAILNDLYEGNEVSDDRLAHLISLFRMEIKDQTGVLDSVRGRPVYLGLAFDEGKKLRLKPQNLIVNLPLAAPG